jgi:hypothetical protein
MKPWIPPGVLFFFILSHLSLSVYSSLLSVFSENKNRLMRSPCSGRQFISPLSLFEWLKQSLWSLVCTYHGTCAHLNCALHKYLLPICVYVYSPIVARQRRGKTATATTDIHAAKKNCWTRRFLCGPCRMNEHRQLVVPRTSCLCN